MANDHPDTEDLQSEIRGTTSAILKLVHSNETVENAERYSTVVLRLCKAHNALEQMDMGFDDPEDDDGGDEDGFDS